MLGLAPPPPALELVLCTLLACCCVAVCRAYKTSTLELRTGQVVTGSGAYNSTRDCGISTQYIAAYNNNNGTCCLGHEQLLQLVCHRL